MRLLCLSHYTAVAIMKHKSRTLGVIIGGHLDKAICLLLQTENENDKHVHGE